MSDLMMTLLLAAAFTTMSLAARTSGREKRRGKMYPLTKCLVSGEALGRHGRPHVLNYHGQQIKLCCKSCLGGFKTEAAALVQIIQNSSIKKRVLSTSSAARLPKGWKRSQ
jgi:hypothetical protein